jgi:hypothetical protein
VATYITRRFILLKRCRWQPLVSQKEAQLHNKYIR